MAITRITKGVIKPNENYDTHNIVSTGIVTSVGLDVNGNADISGSLSVGGVLTYEDVTSIDSVGIITARTGLVSPYADIDDFVSVGNNIHLGNAGVITATSFVGSGAALTGIDATAIKDSGGNVKIQAQASGAIHSGVSTFQDLDVDGHTNLDNVSIAGVTTFADGVAAKFGTDGDLAIFHNNAHAVIENTTGNLHIKDNSIKLQGSNSNQMVVATQGSSVELYYNNVKKLETQNSGVNVYGASTAGGVYLKTSGGTNIGWVYANNSGQYFLQHANSHSILKSVQGSSVELYHNNIKRLETSSVGVSIPQDLDVDGHTNLDNVSIAGITTFSGTGIRIANATNPFIHLKDTTNNTDSFLSTDDGGSLYLKADDNQEGSSTKIVFQVDGSEKIHVTSGGAVSWKSGTTPISGTGNNYSLNIYRDSGGGYGYFDVVTGSSNHTGVILRAYHNGTYNHVLEHTTSDYTRFYTGGNERLRIAANGQITTRGASGTSFNNAGAGDFGSFLTVNGGHTANQWGILSLEGNTSASGYSVGQIQFINQNNANGSSGANVQSRLLAKIEAYSVTSDSNAGDDSGGALRFFTKPEAAQPTERLRITSTGNLKIPDNLKIELGGSQSGSGDFYLNFDGTYATMHSGSNQMNIRSNRIQLGDNGGVLYIDCTDNSTVKLYHQSGGVASEKLTTASFGIDIPDTLRLSNSFADTGSQMCLGADSSGNCTIAGYNLRIATGNNSARVDRFLFSHSAFYPAADNTYDLGAYNYRWKDLYIADAHFSNRDSMNEVDGTWGDWTLQEGESKIFMINNRTGKKYSLVMEEE